MVERVVASVIVLWGACSEAHGERSGAGYGKGGGHAEFFLGVKSGWKSLSDRDFVPKEQTCM